jgi:hypothetical protein
MLPSSNSRTCSISTAHIRLAGLIDLKIVSTVVLLEKLNDENVFQQSRDCKEHWAEEFEVVAGGVV